MTGRTVTDRVWWAPFGGLPCGEGCWHALVADPGEAAGSARVWGMCHWVGAVDFEGPKLPPMLCTRCWRLTRDEFPDAEHRLVTAKLWRDLARQVRETHVTSGGEGVRSA